MLRRVLVLLTLLLSLRLAAAEAPAHPLLPKIDQSLAYAGKYLLSKQGEDGAWRSKVYGFFNDGPSLTPHVLSCIYFVPQAGPDALQAFDRGADYLARLAEKNPEDLELIYPIYTAAEASRMVLKGTQSPLRRTAHEKWLAYMRSHQLNEALGWKADDLEYGGWGYAMKQPRKRQGFRGPWDFSNLSATLYGLGALKTAKTPASDPAFAQALVLIQRCQNHSDDPAARDERFDDGGFFFAPAGGIRNKAGVAGTDRRGRERFPSYGSMTADGLRGLMSCGLEESHPRVRAAKAWLVVHFDVKRNPGEFAPENADIRNATYYYWMWSLAHAMQRLKAREIDTPTGRVDWAEAIAAELLRRQRDDGTWANTFTDGKEDDPLVSTPLAASALAICRQVLSGAAGPNCISTVGRGTGSHVGP